MEREEEAREAAEAAAAAAAADPAGEGSPQRAPSPPPETGKRTMLVDLATGRPVDLTASERPPAWRVARVRTHGIDAAPDAAAPADASADAFANGDGDAAAAAAAAIRSARPRAPPAEVIPVPAPTDEAERRAERRRCWAPTPRSGRAAPVCLRYSHYRLHGFAGRGAATAWAHRPTFGPVEGLYYGPGRGEGGCYAGDEAPPPHVADAVGAADGVAGGRAATAPASGAGAGKSGSGRIGRHVPLTASTAFLAASAEETRRTEREAKTVVVDLQTGRRLRGEGRASAEALAERRADADGATTTRTVRRGVSHLDGRAVAKAAAEAEEAVPSWRKARAVTHRAPAAYAGRRPYHQTYNHYRLYGAAGRGAATSGALNPKLAALGLLQSSAEDRLAAMGLGPETRQGK